MIEFRDGDEVIGRVVRRDGSLIALDSAVQSYVDGWVNRRRAPQDFETFYDGWANGYANARRVDDDLTAAAEVHTGAMIALVPTEEDAERIAVDGGEDADQLHVTLVYLGEAALLPPEVREDLIDSASRWAETFPTIIGKAFAVDMFNPPDLTAGAEPCVVLGIGGDLVANAHEVLLQSANAILGGYGIPLPQQHRPWVAHLTLLYTDDADVRYFTDRIGPVTFDRLRLAFGGDVYDVPLGDADVTAGFDPKQPRDGDGQWTDGPGGSGKHIDWSSIGEHVGQVIAKLDDDKGKPQWRAVVLEKNGKPYLQVQLKRGKKWTKFNDVESAGEYERNITNNRFMKWQSVEPTSADEGDNGPGGKEYEVVNPPGSSNFGMPESEWVFLPEDEAPTGWASGANVISADEASKLHDSVMDRNSWDANIATAVEDYTSSSELLHKAIRAGSTHTSEGDSVRSATRLIDKAMYELPRDVTVFRQIHPSAFGVTDVEDLRNLVGKNFTDKAYLSTSVTQQMRGTDIASDVHMKINVPEGAKAAYVADVSEYPEQDELLLPRRTKLKIRRVEIVNGRAFIEVDVIK